MKHELTQLKREMHSYLSLDRQQQLDAIEHNQVRDYIKIQQQQRERLGQGPVARYCANTMDEVRLTLEDIARNTSTQWKVWAVRHDTALKTTALGGTMIGLMV